MDIFAPIYNKIQSNHPKVIYLSGKSSTGKTTLVNSLHDRYDYPIIELDKVILEIDAPNDMNKFVEIYRKRQEMNLINDFTRRSRNKIEQALNNHSAVLLEGAIATNETLSELIESWSSSFLFVYLEPTSLEAYIERIKNRFKLVTRDYNAGLPADFWTPFSQEQLHDYHLNKVITPEIAKAIGIYAERSMEESVSRVKMFSEKFHDILVIKV